jgi:predicted ester cyclase
MSQAAVPVQLFGVPADGKKVRWTAYDVYRVTNGKISEEWLATIMTQIGAFNPPWAA